ncbi:MAG: MATE family efflux transporter [Bacteroidetes bacterium]|uniref:Multidrug export protein MepA n=1 Tax=Candidatus Egerieousia excrementavium TaxID=2840778 RepID=A0A9D9GVF8_9BACT|nr:MATE family efflux transporter [Candidatus Egerieousia excrementavium]
MTQSIPTELGTEKIGKLLKQYAIPAIIAMTASSLYNMVDSIFIGHGVGAYAIAGLAITFPLMNLGAAFGSLVGVGASSLISMLLGERNYGMAQKVFGNVITLNLLIGLIYTIVVLLFLDPILIFFGGSEQTLPYAREYMVIILWGNMITHMYFGLNAILRAAGFPKRAMYATIFTVVLNTVLDPVFIYVFDMGISGAAIATVLSQFIALCIQLKWFSNKNDVLHFKKGIYNLIPRISKDILAIGASPFLMNVAACFIVILINSGLKKYSGDLAIGAYGIINRVAFIFVMIVMGLNQGMQPIVGYNYGAKKFDRVHKTLVTTILLATGVTTFGFLIAELFPKLFIVMFTTESELIDIAEKGMRIIFMFFPIVGFQMVTTNFFQSVGMAGKSIFLSLSRQLIFLAPCLVILPIFFDVTGIWMSMAVADALASIIAAFMLTNQIKQFKRAINGE